MSTNMKQNSHFMSKNFENGKSEKFPYAINNSLDKNKETF